MLDTSAFHFPSPVVVDTEALCCSDSISVGAPPLSNRRKASKSAAGSMAATTAPPLHTTAHTRHHHGRAAGGVPHAPRDARTHEVGGAVMLSGSNPMHACIAAIHCR